MRGLTVTGLQVGSVLFIKLNLKLLYFGLDTVHNKNNGKLRIGN